MFIINMSVPSPERSISKLSPFHTAKKPKGMSPLKQLMPLKMLVISKDKIQFSRNESGTQGLPKSKTQTELKPFDTIMKLLLYLEQVTADYRIDFQHLNQLLPLTDQ